MNKKTNTTIYIIILNYNTYEDTIKLVHKLFLQEKIQLHIVIVDNHSPNGSFEKINEAFKHNDQVEIIQSDVNGGYSSGNNLGLRYIGKYNPKYVGILNNDVHLEDRTLLPSLINELNNNSEAYFVAPTMVLAGKEHFTAWKLPTITSDIRKAVLSFKRIFGDPDRYHFPKERKTEYVDCLPGSFLLGHYPKFQQLGFFDEDIFLFGEENILGYKIKMAGGTNLLCRQYTFEHAWSSTINKSINRIQRIRLQNSGKILFHEKYLKTSPTLISTFKFLLRIRLLEEYILTLIRNPKSLIR